MLWPVAAAAHATGQAFVLLLPTGVWTVAGVAVVAATFLATALMPAGSGTWGRPRGRIGRPGGVIAVSLMSTGAVFALLLAGVLGPRDPLANPLPLVFWTLIWVALVGLAGGIGSPWRWLSPWAGVVWGLRRLGLRPVARLPGALADGVAAISVLAFAGFLLADPAPADPARLAFFGALYWGGTLLGAVIFGPVWLRRAELFGVVFRWFGALAPVDWHSRRIGWPGWQIIAARGGAAFMATPLLLLAVGSFDGLNETFLWLSWLGINPLEFPGRSAVVGANVLGLGVAVVLLLALFFVATWLGDRLARGGPGAAPGVGSAAALRLAPCVLPIALAYHIAHYLPGFLVDIQYVAVMLAGWAGLSPPVVSTGFFFDPGPVRLIWLTQGAVVVAGHMMALLLAHAVALELYASRRRALLSQLPMGAFMVAYTFFGLWLLAAPRGA